MGLDLRLLKPYLGKKLDPLIKDFPNQTIPLLTALLPVPFPSFFYVKQEVQMLRRLMFKCTIAKNVLVY